MSTGETTEIEGVIIEAESTSLPPPPITAMVKAESDLVPTMVGDIKGAKARMVELQEFVRDVMVEGEDYGQIPGVKKAFLFKPGAEKLAEIYGYSLMITITKRIEDWTRGFFHYETRCDVISRRSGAVIGMGVGSCNSMESRYRWRDAQRACPACGVAAIIKGKVEYGGGWLCFAKKGGCGAKFDDTDQAIVGQTQCRVENDDVYTLVNTILKMSAKRSKVDAVISVTRSSALFTQDEDTVGQQAERTAQPAQASKPQPAAARAPGTPKANQHSGPCIHCNAEDVPAGGGYLVKVAEKWKPISLDCYAARVAAEAERDDDAKRQTS